jgi:hypothetical protein
MIMSERASTGAAGGFSCRLRDRTLALCGLVLLAVNLVLALLHGAYFICLRYGLDAWPRDPLFSLSSNAGLAQAFNSAQTLLLIAVLLGLAQRTRELLYLALGAVFVLVLLDDALALNQLLGAPLAGALGLVDRPRLLAQSLAEMLVYGALALPVVALLGIGWRRARPPHRRAGAGFLALLALLAFFATVMDLIHLAFIKSFFGSRLVLEVAEEGGEMVTLSAALLLALALARHLPANAPPGRPLTGADTGVPSWRFARLRR